MGKLVNTNSIIQTAIKMNNVLTVQPLFSSSSLDKNLAHMLRSLHTKQRNQIGKIKAKFGTREVGLSAKRDNQH